MADSTLWQVVPINSGSSGSLAATPAVTIPAGSGAKVARLVVEWNNDAVTANDPAGWTRDPAGALTNGSVLRSAVWKRTLLASDDETSLSVTFNLGLAGGVRCTGALVIFSDAVDDQVVTTAQTTTGAASQSIPASSTATSSSLAVAVLAVTAPTTAGVTPPAGWTEAADTWTTNASGGKHGAWVGVRDTRVAAAGATAGTPATTTDTAARSNAYVFLLSNAPELPEVSAGSGWQFGSFAMRSS